MCRWLSSYRVHARLIFFTRNLPQSAVPLSKLSSLKLISDYICKLKNEQIQLQLFAVNDVSKKKNIHWISCLLSLSSAD